MADIWRMLHGTEFGYTWHRRKPRKHFARLDFFLTSCSLANRVHKAGHTYGFATDHSAITLHIYTSLPARGPGFWKFNIPHLNDAQYLSGVREVIKESKKKYIDCDPAMQWEMTKCEIAGYSSLFSRITAAKKKEKLANYTRALNYLSTLMVTDDDEEVIKEFEKISAEMELYMQEKTQTLMFMSRANYHLEGERNSKYFLSKAKKQAMKKIMLYLENDKGETVSGIQNILEEQIKYYESLYSADANVIFNLSNETNVKISEEERRNLETPITKEELKTAVSLFAPDKTPGCDGFPALFYQTLWDDISDMYFEAILFAFESNKLHISARRGYLSLLLKKNRNILKLKNWRPLTMLSMDFKILSKTLDRRLKTCIGTVISDYQTGFMEDRLILNNVIKLMEIMDTADANKLQQLIMLIDFEKCFNMISHTAIIGALNYFGFGPNFAKWVMVLFTDFQLCTQNHGFTSRWITATRGVHQGCCISPHIFILTGQVFAHILEHNDHIDGITAHGIFLLLSQFADDTSLFLKANRNELNSVIDSLALAERNLGLKVNYDKTTIYRIGSSQHTIARLYTQKNFVWDDPPIQTLGITVDTDWNNMAQLNINPVIQKARETLTTWNATNLTLTGRVLVVNTFVEFLCVYPFTVLPYIPQNMLQQLHEIIWKFIWKNKRPKIRFDVLKQLKNHGGLRLVDLESKHIALLIQAQFNCRKDAFLNKAMMNFLDTPLKDNLRLCNINHKEVNYLFQRKCYWTGMFEAWCKYNYHIPKKYSEVKNQLLHYNSHIKINNKFYISQKAIEGNILAVADLLDENGSLHSWDSFNQKHPGVLQWLEYYSIVDALPKDWITLIDAKQRTTDKHEHRYTNLVKLKKVTAKVYKELILIPNVMNGAVNRWNKPLEESISREEIVSSLQWATSLTISTKLRDYQFRLMHKILPTNKELYRWKIVDSNICNFCAEVDSIEHTMFKCNAVNRLWCALPMLIEELTGTHSNEIVINFHNVLLNKIHSGSKHVANFICLIVKQSIYRFKCQNKTLTLCKIKYEIQTTEMIELYSAIKNNKVSIHNKKWKSIKSTDNNSFNSKEIVRKYIRSM